MMPATLTRKDFLSILDFDALDLERCLGRAAQLKADRRLASRGPTAGALCGRHVAMLGVHLHMASPEAYQLPHAVVQQSTAVARHGARLRLFSDPADAVANADAIYTDTWTSMGQEAEADSRRAVFRPYQVNEALMARAEPGALFMHCLPAHRGEEVTADVFESAASAVFDQAENRLHVQKALLLMLLASADTA